MSYDGNENLIEMTLPNGATESRSYDGYDRITQKTLVADGVTHTTNYIYDDNGNLLSQEINGQLTSTSYDLFDRPTLVIDALGNTLSYSYDVM
jgi:YD repeat-containing protein